MIKNLKTEILRNFSPGLVEKYNVTRTRNDVVTSISIPDAADLAQFIEMIEWLPLNIRQQFKVWKDIMPTPPTPEQIAKSRDERSKLKKVNCIVQ